jgi:hypothetical protein
MSEKINYGERRKRFMETFKDDVVLTETLPKLAAELFNREFGITLSDPTLIPVTWSVCWNKLMEFIHQQKSDSFSMSVAGMDIEYTTEYSESDKARNIVPELYHKFIPNFTVKQHTVVPGSDYNNELTKKYNDWRTTNMTETLDIVERNVFVEVAEKYGISLMVSATVFPLIAATYAAGIRIALETKKPVNMYNWFTITARDGDKIILTPLASIKQGLKDDAKRA